MAKLIYKSNNHPNPMLKVGQLKSNHYFNKYETMMKRHFILYIIMLLSLSFNIFFVFGK